MPEKVTLLLNAASNGDREAAARVYSEIYDTLRAIARSKLAGEASGQTLDTTGLVHETYLRLVERRTIAWQSRRHFFATAAEAMRCILVDQARRRQSLRRGAAYHHVSLEGNGDRNGQHDEDLLLLDLALRKLEEVAPRRAQVVKLRYFTGLTIEETADVLGISPATVKTDWSFARAWLHQQIDQQPGRTRPEIGPGGVGALHAF